MLLCLLRYSTSADLCDWAAQSYHPYCTHRSVCFLLLNILPLNITYTHSWLTYGAIILTNSALHIQKGKKCKICQIMISKKFYLNLIYNFYFASFAFLTPFTYEQIKHINTLFHFVFCSFLFIFYIFAKETRVEGGENYLSNVLEYLFAA